MARTVRARGTFCEYEMVNSSLPPDTVLCAAEGLDLVLVSDDELLVQFGTRSRPSELFRDDDMTSIIGRMIGALSDGPCSVAALLARVADGERQDALGLLETLVEQGLLSDAGRDPVQQYLRYTFDGDTSVSAARVAVIGAGPVGARLAANLLRQGVAGVSVVDSRSTDLVWQRSMPFPVRHPPRGAPAGAALAASLREAGHANVSSLDRTDGAALEQAVEGCDLAILAVERPDLELAHALNRACVRARRPWLMTMIDGNLGIVGPQFQPPDTACYNDYQTLARAAAPDGAMARRHRRHLLANRSVSFLTGLPAYADIVAGHGSLAAAHYLVRGTSHLLGRVMIMDFDGMRIDTEEVLKLPRCPVCATRRPPYRPPFPEGAEAIG